VVVSSGCGPKGVSSVFRQKLRPSAPAYSIKKNTTNGFQTFPIPDSVTGSEPYDEELKHTLATHGLRVY